MYSRKRILEHKAVLRRHIDLGSGQHEYVRCRLAVRDIGARDNRVEQAFYANGTKIVLNEATD